MENINLLMGITSHQKELAKVKSILYGMTIMGFDDASAGTYSAMERALEKEITEYELQNGLSMTCRKGQNAQSRTDAIERHKNLLARIAEYF
jgi:hypothetical protein